MIPPPSGLRFRTAYLPLGLAALGLVAAALLLGVGGRRLLQGSSGDVVFAYAAATGFCLVICFAWQWRLHLARYDRDGGRIRREYIRHRWVGIIPALILICHIGGPNASLMSIISYAFLASSLVGLFNQEIVDLGSGRLKTFWLVTHIGLASLIVPLILVHIWAALAFRVS
jgi:hypothetical protein